MNKDWIADLAGLTVTCMLFYLLFHLVKAWILS